MKKKIFFLGISLLGIISLASCGEEASSSTKEETSSTNDSITYTINVYDIDDEKLGSKVITGTKDDNLFEKLKDNFDVVYSESEYGPYLTSINGQIVDSNWFVSIYENNVSSPVGVNQIKVDDNDVFDFKMECWNTKESGYGQFDSYDVLVDKVLYHYAKTAMNEALAKATTYTGSDYWTMATINMMSTAKNQYGLAMYDANVFNVNSLSQEFKDSVNNCDVNTLNGANIGKWYYAASAMGVDLTNFKTFYQGYLNDSLSTTYSEWTTPFVISCAKKLNMTSAKLDQLLASDYLAGTEYGVDGLCWQIASNAMFDKYDQTILNNLNLNDEGNGASTALKLMAYASLNVSPRQENNDLIKVLLDNYYDSNFGYIKYLMTDEGFNYSTNQIYASLFTYKVARDSGEKAFIFA